MTAIYYKALPDEIIFATAKEGDPLAVDEANRRGLSLLSDNVSKSLEQALSHVKIEWIEE